MKIRIREDNEDWDEESEDEYLWFDGIVTSREYPSGPGYLIEWEDGITSSTENMYTCLEVLSYPNRNCKYKLKEKKNV